MYVLIDMEWVTNRHGNHWPTQLAAIRVDEECTKPKEWR